MKSPPPSARRPYQQGVRAAAAEATSERILTAFLARLESQWFDEITLEAVARDAGVSVQTVIRRFGGKEALLEAAINQFSKGVIARRGDSSGDIGQAIAVIADDYEASGDLVLRFLAQEQRHQALKAASDMGRAHHRKWVETVFAPWLGELAPAAQTARVDALVVATDLYVWKLIRRDMGRPVAAYAALVKSLINAALNSTPKTPPETA